MLLSPILSSATCTGAPGYPNLFESRGEKSFPHMESTTAFFGSLSDLDMVLSPFLSFLGILSCTVLLFRVWPSVDGCFVVLRLIHFAADSYEVLVEGAVGDSLL